MALPGVSFRFVWKNWTIQLWHSNEYYWNRHMF